MTVWLHLVALSVLASLGGALWRVWRGPSPADRMMAAQLVGTGGVAALMLLAPLRTWAALDVALALALLAALAAVGFVKATSPDGAGDPEETAPSPLPGAHGDGQAPEQPRQNPHMQEEARAAGHPPGAVG